MGPVLRFDHRHSACSAARSTSMKDRSDLSQTFVATWLFCNKVYQPASTTVLGGWSETSVRAMADHHRHQPIRTGWLPWAEGKVVVD
jgi:hypothetical protein